MDTGISPNSPGNPDLEKNDHQFLINHTVQEFSWSGLTVTVKDRQTKQVRDLINDVSGSTLQGMPHFVAYNTGLLTRQVSWSP